jgi:hypothetical protein
MTASELACAMAELRLRHDASITRAVLGVTGRSIRYYIRGQKPVPPPLANLIGVLLMLHREGLSLAQVSTLVGSRGIPLGVAPPRPRRERSPNM